MAILSVVFAAPLVAQDRLAIKGARILPVAGSPIDNGVILIAKGKIEAVGKDIVIPAGVKVIDAAGKVVVPGFIEAHSTRGMDQVNETNPNVPFLSVIDAIDPSRDYFEECRRNGVTTAAVVPGNNTMFGGQAAVLKTAGEFVDQMVIKRGVGLKISLKPATDRNRMGHVATIRKELDDARDALADKNKAGAAKPPAVDKPAAEPPTAADDPDTQQRRPRPAGGSGANFGGAPDAALVREALQKLLKGELIAFIYCELVLCHTTDLG